MDKVFEALMLCVTEGKCTNTDCPYEYQCELIRNGQSKFIQIPKVLALDVLALLKEQERIIKQYQKADGFLFAHGWKWENYIDTQEEPHQIEVGEDGLPY